MINKQMHFAVFLNKYTMIIQFTLFLVRLYFRTLSGRQTYLEYIKATMNNLEKKLTLP